MRARRESAWGMLVTATTLVSCRSEPPAAIVVRAGAAPELHRSFAPTSALAEYLELPKTRSELRLLLSDYEVGCESFVPPQQDQTFVSVLVVTPPDAPLTPGTYAWGGTEAHGSPNRPERPFSMPKVMLGGQSHLFRPGGSIRLTKLGLDPNGAVEGVLAFEFAGDATAEATSLRGNFRAKICAIGLAKKP